MDTSRLPLCHVLIEPEPLSGVENMARDAAMLHDAMTQGRCWLRFYRWNEPTVSLGYFQEDSPHDLPPEARSLPRVKRLSGGGSLIHHNELTYSCAIPAHQKIVADPISLYPLIHQLFIQELNLRGCQLSLRGQTSRQTPEPMLCFAREDANDVVAQNPKGCHPKVLGSAQRRRRGNILQHGGLVIRASPHASQFPGLFDFFPRWNDEGFVQSIASSIASVFAEKRVESSPVLFMPNR